MKHFALGIILVLMATSVTTAQEQREMTLDDAVSFALANNTELINTRIESDILREQAFEVMTEGFPKLSGKLDYNWNFQQQTTVIPAGAFPGQTTDLDATFLQPHIATLQADWQQLVFDARYLFGMKARKLFLEIADYQSEIGETDAKVKVSEAYYAALVAEESKEVLKRNQAVLQGILYETTKVYEAGLTDELSVDRLVLNLSNLETEIARAENRSHNAMRNLKYVMGMEQDDELILAEDLTSMMQSQSSDLLQDRGTVENRTEYQLLASRAELRGYDVKQARSTYFPNLYLYGRYGTQAFRDQFDFFDTDQRWFDFGSMGFTLNVNLFDGLAARSKVQQRKLQQQQQRNQVKDFEEAYRLQTEVARNNLADAISRYELQKENLALAEKIYQKTNIMFKEGVGSSLELSQAQADLTTTLVSYSQAVYDVLVARLELKKALGTL